MLNVHYLILLVRHITKIIYKKGKRIRNLGADSICIKDMSGILTPYIAFELVTELKRQLKFLYRYILTIPVVSHR